MTEVKDILGSREVHLWLASPGSIYDPALLSAYDRLMSPGERRKQRRFKFQKDRHTCLVTRALVRTVLSRYASVNPEKWVFVQNSYGRPELVPGQCDLPLRFNLSHTEGLIACAVTLSHDIGVDVESTERKGETVAIADRFFSTAEVRLLNGLPECKQRERFFQYWTLKECYIKARGMGLSLPLEQFTLHLDDPGSIHISFDSRMKDDPLSWQFDLLRPTARHVGAVGVRRGFGPDFSVCQRWTVPLTD